jgi:predicted methyltransferase
MDMLQRFQSHTTDPVISFAGICIFIYAGVAIVGSVAFGIMMEGFWAAIFALCTFVASAMSISTYGSIQEEVQRECAKQVAEAISTLLRELQRNNPD